MNEFRPLSVTRSIWASRELDVESKAILQAIVLRTTNSTGATPVYPKKFSAKLRWIALTTSLCQRTVIVRLKQLARDGYVVVRQHWDQYNGAQRSNSYVLQVQRFAPQMASTARLRSTSPAIPAHEMAATVIAAVAAAPRAVRRRA